MAVLRDHTRGYSFHRSGGSKGHAESFARSSYSPEALRLFPPFFGMYFAYLEDRTGLPSYSRQDQRSGDDEAESAGSVRMCKDVH